MNSATRVEAILCGRWCAQFPPLPATRTPPTGLVHRRGTLDSRQPTTAQGNDLKSKRVEPRRERAREPNTQPGDLQVICLLKHEAGRDVYIGALEELNDKFGGLISSLRETGEFIGYPGETLLLTAPPGSIAAKQLLLIGVGDSKKLSLDELRLAGRIAAREAVRLQAAHVAFAPALRDQGSNTIEVGEGGAAVAEQIALATRIKFSDDDR